MKSKHGLILSFICLATASCTSDHDQKNVISERYIHKYGYDVSKEEWEILDYTQHC